MTIPMAVCACWHGDRCPWFQRGQCWFRHEGLPPKPSPPISYHDDLQELRDGFYKLREAVSKLAAAVMWRNGVPLPHSTGHESTKDAHQERTSERTPRQTIDSPVPRDETHHQRFDQDCPGDNVARNIRCLDKNDAPDFAPPGRLEHDAVEPDGEPISLPTHTASNPSTEKLLTVEMPHQRIDQACPDDKVALHFEDLDKNNMQETYAHARRSEQGIVKPGEDVVSLPTHTASNPSTEEVFTVETPHQRLDRASPGGKVP